MTEPLVFLFPPTLGERWRTQTESLAASLSEGLARAVQVQVAPSYPHVEIGALDARADIVWAPPVVCARVGHAARALFKVVRGGESVYRAAVLCRTGDATRAQAWRGMRAAWVDPISTAGYRLPHAWAQKQGLDPDRLLVAQGFRGTYREALSAVLAKEADISSVFVRRADVASVAIGLREAGLPDAEGKLEAFGFTHTSPTDGLFLTSRISDSEVARLGETLRSATKGGALYALLLACNGEGFLDATPEEYRAAL